MWNLVHNVKFWRWLSVGISLLVFLVPDTRSEAASALVRISHDPYTNPGAQHRTQVEPDSFAFGNTIVAAFQSGRFYNGGASNIGWATSADGGKTWTHGFLPNTTTAVGGPFERLSDPSVTYDAKHGVWLINSLSLWNVHVIVSRSADGGLTWQNPILISGPNMGYDKNWIACDNHTSSPYYGNCYAAWDDANAGGLIYVAVSSDGGATWNTTTIADTSGLGVQPLALPNGTVVIPYLGFDNTLYAVRSTDGGANWSEPRLITTVTDHVAAGRLRTMALPSAEMDGGGKIYLVWQDCRFIKNCAANDLVMSASTDGVTWTRIKRIPLDPRKRRVDHFIPGIATDSKTSGSTAHLALAYYYYDNAACDETNCLLNVGYASSINGGATWSAKTKLAGPMQNLWLANTSLGYMVGDYISTSIVKGKAVPIFSVARSLKEHFRQATYAPQNPLRVTGGAYAATTPRIQFFGTNPSRKIPFTVP